MAKPLKETFVPRQALLPASNVRGVLPRVCATCCYGCIEDGGFFCIRRGGFFCDASDLTQWATVCDRWKADPDFPVGGKPTTTG